MEGCFLRFYVHEGRRHQGRPLWEWLLVEANRLGILGGSAFRAMAGFGRDRVLHESTFFELAGTLTVEVEFIVTEEQSRVLLAQLERERIRVFYAHIPARFGVLNPEASEAAAGT